VRVDATYSSTISPQSTNDAVDDDLKWLSHFDQAILPIVASEHDDEYKDMLRSKDTGSPL